MAGGFRNVMGWLLGWRSAPVSAATAPYRVAAAGMFCCGAAAGQARSSGAAAAEAFSSGAAAGRAF